MQPRLLWPVGLTFWIVAGCASSDVASPSSSLANEPSLASAAAWGPESPPFNNEIILRGDGFGLVKFRQPNDGERIVMLDTWVRDLTPNTSYLLQRAVDTNVDDVCTSSAWLTLGKGLTAHAITTDARGTGREELFRNLGTIAVGTTFDIHFRVIDATTLEVVLSSACYQFTVTE